MLASKIILNSVISDANKEARFVSADIKIIFSNTNAKARIHESKIKILTKWHPKSTQLRL